MKETKKFLIYIGHPSQYHFYKNVVKELRKNGHFVNFVIRSKDMLEELMVNDGQSFVNILPEGRNNNKSSIFHALLKRDVRLYKLLKRQDYDLLIGSDASITHIGKLLSIPRISVTEDDYQIIKTLAKLSFPFTNWIFAPVPCNVGKWESKKIAYHGYQKLAYLHPKYFSPDKRKVCIHQNEKYFLIRLSGLTAHHDFGIKGFNITAIKKIISVLSKYGKVFISSENKMEEELHEYKLIINPNDIHHYLYFANLLISDSQSMSMEAALLGTPSLRLSDFAGRISVLEELEKKYALTFGFKSIQLQDLISKLEELLVIKDLKEEFQKRRLKMLNEKIDVTKFMVWLLENYPESVRIIKNNPNYQFNFT